MRNDDMIIRFGGGRILIVLDRETVYDGQESECPPHLLAEVEGFNHTPEVIQEEPKE